MAGYKLHPTLERDTIWVDAWPLSDVLLMNDANYPWALLVPRRGTGPGSYVREIYELSPEDQIQLARESVHLGKNLMAAFSGHKLNVAALGNMVPQLHVHHIVRYSSDAAWPGPVWGAVPAKPLCEADVQHRVEAIRSFSARF